jgi:ribosome-binding factor A
LPQTHRLEKVNQLIRQELSNLLLRDTKDPRLSGYVSINSVATTPDLRHAKILVSCVCEEERKKEILEALHSASGFFRSEMGKVFKIRRVPELHFTWDSSIERGSDLLSYMDQVFKDEQPGAAKPEPK